MLCKCDLCCHAVSVCPSVYLSFCHVRDLEIWVRGHSRSLKLVPCQNEWTCLQNFSPSGSHTIPVFPYWTSWRYSDGDPPPHNGAIKCRCYRQRSQFWANIWLHRVLWTLPPLGVIKTVPPDRGKLWHLTLVVSGGVCWWRETTTKCLWQEVSTYDKKSQRYAKDNRTAFNRTQW